MEQKHTLGHIGYSPDFKSGNPHKRTIPVNRCLKSHEGWTCTQENGHTGTCASIPDNLRQPDKADIAMAMVRFGGAFWQNMGQALLRADPDNVDKIKATWPDEWRKYCAHAVITSKANSKNEIPS